MRRYQLVVHFGVRGQSRETRVFASFMITEVYRTRFSSRRKSPLECCRHVRETRCTSRTDHEGCADSTVWNKLFSVNITTAEGSGVMDIVTITTNIYRDCAQVHNMVLTCSLFSQEDHFSPSKNTDISSYMSENNTYRDDFSLISSKRQPPFCIACHHGIKNKSSNCRAT